MNERRRIIVPIGNDADQPLSAPRFDSDATMTARPVVPLSDQETFQMNYGAYQGNAPKPFWKRPAVVAVVVLLAVAAGVAAAYAVSLYRSRQAAKALEANQPAVVGESAAGRPAAEQSVPPEVPPVVATDPSPSPDDRKAEERETDQTSPPAIDDQPTRPVVRDKTPEKSDDDREADREARQAEREQRREERRERRRRQREDVDAQDIPSRIDRAGREINGRIREIFEGRQP